MKAAIILLVQCVVLVFSLTMVGSDLLNTKFGVSVKMADRFVTLFPVEYRFPPEYVLLFAYIVLGLVLVTVLVEWFKGAKKAMGG